MRRPEEPRPRRRRRPAGLLCLLALGAAAGCTEDQFERPGTWRPTGANEANFRLMVADPAQLRPGVGVGTDRGQAGSGPITRLEAGRRAPLPDTRVSKIGQVGTGDTGGGDGTNGR
jgi:hypothetical protein